MCDPSNLDGVKAGTVTSRAYSAFLQANAPDDARGMLDGL